MTTQKLINDLFDKLDNWRNLPAYQLERRADIFFALYLNDLIQCRFNEKLDFIIPEFPLRIGNLYKNKILSNPNLSFKIDYVCVCNSKNKVFLIELKTDDSSRREKQDWYLKMAQRNNIRDLIDGVLNIYQATSSKKKYQNLLALLSEVGWVDMLSMTNISHDYDIEVVYIQPNSLTLSKNIITFQDIIDYLSNNNDDLTNRFKSSLQKWIVNPN